MSMKTTFNLTRFLPPCYKLPRVGLYKPKEKGFNLYDLTDIGIRTTDQLVLLDDPASVIESVTKGRALSRATKFTESSGIKMLSPLDNLPVWAAGVTYGRSQTARNKESAKGRSSRRSQSKKTSRETEYDKVGDKNHRPEIFSKFPKAGDVGGHGQSIAIRNDATSSVPEPELALVINPDGKVVALTIGDDVTARSIEADAMLNLPDAKTYDACLALGPFVQFGSSEEDARSWDVTMVVERGSKKKEIVFTGQTSVNDLRRRFDELSAWLFNARQEMFKDGVVLLTGTGIIPEPGFTLECGDRVLISIGGKNGGLGTLINDVISIGADEEDVKAKFS